MCSSDLQIASKYQSRIMPLQSETFSHFLALSYALYIRSSLTTSTCVDLDALPAAFDSSHEYLPASASPAAAIFTLVEEKNFVAGLLLSYQVKK